jgi:hypothetical protein
LREIEVLNNSVDIVGTESNNRTMSLFIERKLDTELGPIDIAITRADHISVNGQPVVRDTKFNCHLHFWLQADGNYAVREQDRPSMSRAWVNGMSNADYNKPAPATYFAKVLTAYTKWINYFMASNPELAVQAESEDIEREIGSAQAKVEKARKELSDAVKALAALEAKRRKHMAHSNIEIAA